MTASVRNLGKRLYRLFGSFGLAIVLLFLLFVLTFLGTLEQTQMGLYDVQKKYFTSFFLLHRFGNGFVIPLPGVYLLMVLLSANLIVGGIIRMRRGWSMFGLYVTHGGILLLMVGSLVTHYFTLEGHMTLAPGETSNVFQSYNEWEIAVLDTSDPESDTEYVIPIKDLHKVSGASGQEYRLDPLPFDLTVAGYVRNAMPRPANRAMSTAAQPVINGFYLEEQPVQKQNELNTPAAYVTMSERRTGETTRDFLWGRSIDPLDYRLGGVDYKLSLRRRRWTVPYAITLTKFIHEKYPGIGMAKNYESRVIKTENGDKVDIAIRMNEPLRHRGYTFFQSSFSENPRTGVTSSTFAVVKNPADQFPLVALIIITSGLLLHFGLKLARHLKTEQGQRA